MPPTPAWQGRLAEIRAALESLEAPALDRSQVEQLFGVARRRAQALMAGIEKPRHGCATRVPREALLALLDTVGARRNADEEVARQVRLRARLAEERRLPPSLPVFRPAADQAQLFPPGISLTGPGELRLRFSSPGGLLGSILVLLEQQAADPQGFADLLNAAESKEAT